MAIIKKNTGNPNQAPIYICRFYAAVFGNVDRHRDKIHKGAFADAIKSGRLPMVYCHDYKEPISKKVTTTEDDFGLLIEAEVPYLGAGKKFIDEYYNGMAEGYSFGFQYGDIEWNDKGNYLDVFTIKEIYEVSPASVPCNDKTKTVEVKPKQ